MTEPGRRNTRSEATRARLLDTAERLYAERGLGSVSNRTILEAAGEANKGAVTYHFGPGDGLLKALLARHSADIARRCAETMPSRGPVAGLILGVTGHLESLGAQSWGARLFAQVEADPRAREVARSMGRLGPVEVAAEAATAIVDGPAEVAALRFDAARITVVGICAEREAAGARTGTPPDWPLIGEVLTDLVTAMLTAPIRDRLV